MNAWSVVGLVIELELDAWSVIELVKKLIIKLETCFSVASDEVFVVKFDVQPVFEPRSYVYDFVGCLYI